MGRMWLPACSSFDRQVTLPTVSLAVLMILLACGKDKDPDLTTPVEETPAFVLTVNGETMKFPMTEIGVFMDGSRQAIALESPCVEVGDGTIHCCPRLSIRLADTEVGVHPLLTSAEPPMNELAYVTGVDRCGAGDYSPGFYNTARDYDPSPHEVGRVTITTNAKGRLEGEFVATVECEFNCDDGPGFISVSGSFDLDL